MDVFSSSQAHSDDLCLSCLQGLAILERVIDTVEEAIRGLIERHYWIGDCLHLQMKIQNRFHRSTVVRAPEQAIFLISKRMYHLKHLNLDCIGYKIDSEVRLQVLPWSTSPWSCDGIGRAKSDDVEHETSSFVSKTCI